MGWGKRFPGFVGMAGSPAIRATGANTNETSPAEHPSQSIFTPWLLEGRQR